MITDTLYEARTLRAFLRAEQELKDYWASIRARLERGMEGSACREVCRVALHVADAYAALGHAARDVLGMVTPQDRDLLEQQGEGEAAVQAVFDAIDRFRAQVLQVQQVASRPAPPAPVEALRAAEAGPFVRLKGD